MLSVVLVLAVLLVVVPLVVGPRARARGSGALDDEVAEDGRAGGGAERSRDREPDGLASLEPPTHADETRPEERHEADGAGCAFGVASTRTTPAAARTPPATRLVVETTPSVW